MYHSNISSLQWRGECAHGGVDGRCIAAIFVGDGDGGDGSVSDSDNE